MHKFTKLCLRKPVSTVIIILALIIFGCVSVPSMNMQLTPNMELPMIIAYTIYPQAGPEEVERQVSRKLENCAGAVAGLDSITTQSQENVSYVQFTFKYGTDMDDAFMDLQEAISTVQNDLPEKAKTPTLIVMDINATDAMDISVSSKNGANVLNYVEDVVTPELDKITDVARKETYGGSKDYISVELIPERLSQYKLNISTISTYLSAANFAMPAGKIDIGNQTLNVSAEVDYSTLENISNIPITTGTGEAIHLSDVANVHFNTSDTNSISRYNGQDEVTIGIVKKTTANAVTLSKKVNKLITELNEKNQDYEITSIYDSSTAILASIKSVTETLILGVILSMIVLFLFFGDIKASLIVGSSMPISLLVTFILMYACGYSLNIVTMGALVIGIGMMVDNSIVVLEMCFRKKAEGATFEEAAYAGVKTVVLSITASTLTTIVVFLPLAMMKGLSGQLFGPLGFTIIFSLTASLIAAISLVPLCFSKYQPKERTESPINKILAKISDWYGRVLSKVLKHRLLAVIIAVILFIASICCIPFMHTELMPSTDEGTIKLAGTMRSGLSLEVKNEVLTDLENYVKNDPDVQNYSVSTESGSSSLTVNAYLKKGRSRSTTEVMDEWNKELEDYPNCEILCSMSSTMSMGGGGGNQYEVDIQGSNMDDLRVAASQVEEMMRGVNGIFSTSSTFSDSSTKAEIQVDPIKAAAVSMTPAQIAQMIYQMKMGSDAMTVSIDDKDYTVTVEYPRETFDDVTAMMNTTLTTNRGTSVVLSDVADIVYTDAPQTVIRQDGQYVVSIFGNMLSDQKYNVEDDVKAQMEVLQLPKGVEQATSSYNEMMGDEFTSILMATATALWLVFMVMAMQFESVRYAGMVMICVPFAMIGSFGLLLATGCTLSMTSLMGFLMLGGIVVNNGILFVDTTNQYRATMSTDVALVETGKSRLRPILMTTLTTILSMVPLAIGVGENGKVMQGMAVVIVGGLTASTILTLLLLPTFYMIIHKHSKAKKLKKKARLAAKEAKEAEKSALGDDSKDNSEEATMTAEDLKQDLGER